MYLQIIPTNLNFLIYQRLVKSILAFTHPLCSIYIASQLEYKIANFFMVNNFSVDQVGLYINWANTSLFIILGKLPTLNLPIKSHPSLRQLAIFSDVILVSNYHGCKEEAINLIPHYLIDIIHKTVKPSHLQKL